VIDAQGKYRKISALVDEWLQLHVGEKFGLDTICRQLQIAERENRHCIVKKLSYEANKDKPEIEKLDRFYRYIDRKEKKIEWQNASMDDVLDIRWPYGIEDDSQFGFDGKVRVSPGDIIVVAGVSNMGKTCLCHNFLWENMDNHACTLMGNEYTASKFKRRVSRMTWHNPIDVTGKPKFELIERRENWKDIIRPDNINIIDWLNLGENWYEIGKVIEGIQSKLNKGIALISIQKDEHKTLGRGAGFSEELASLYLTMDFGRLYVRKCKEWVETNPNGKAYGFDIVDGGVKFHRIRQIVKCKKCWGSGQSRGSECEECNGSGFRDA